MENQEQQSTEPQMPVQPVVETVSEQEPEPKKSLPKWPLLIVGIILVLTLIIGIYFLGQKSMNKVSEKPPTVTQTPTSPPTPDPTINWITYASPFLPFSLKYPAEDLTNDFQNIDPNALAKRLQNNASDIDQYVESRYYGNGVDGFDDSDNTGLGSLLPLSSFIPNNTYRYRGIRFTQYYLGSKDISSLAPYFRNNKGFSTININGATVGLFDGTTKATGIPPAYIKTYYFRIGSYVLSVSSFIFASSTQEEKNKIFTLLDNLVRTIKINGQPSLPPMNTITPTPTPIPFMINSIDPGYVPMNYFSLGKNHLAINGSQFQNGAHVVIEGPYDLQSGQIVANQTYHQFQLTNTVFDSSQKIEGLLPDGLPNGYFRIVITNPDGSSASTGLSLLRGGDPNEK